MKILKKTLKILGITFLSLLLILIMIPILFGGHIKEAVRNYVNNQIEGEVYFEDVSIGIFSSFPNLTVSLTNFGVAGGGEFQGDTLVDAASLDVTVNLWSALFGDTYEVSKIQLDEPRIHAIVSQTGKVNWDILKPSEAAEEPVAADTSQSAPVHLQLQKVSVSDGYIVYDDHFGNVFLELDNLNFDGTGDLKDEVFDFDTYTTAEGLTLRMGGVNYFYKAKLGADMTLNIDNAKSRYTLRDNTLSLNALNISADGWVEVTDKDVGMDLQFKTNENQFRQVLSLVPGMYTESFDDLDTDGTFSLNGYARGRYTVDKLPGFNVNLSVKDGYFKYPDLPSEVKAINAKVNVDCPSGNLEALLVDVQNFNANFGGQPLSGNAKLAGLMGDVMSIDGAAKGDLDLGSLGKMFPMEGQELRGKLHLDAKAKGKYGEKQFPVVSGDFSLADGYYKHADFPGALSEMRMQAKVENVSENMATAVIDIPQFHAKVDGEPLDARLHLENLDNPLYDLMVKGNLNFAKLKEILAWEDTEMKGTMALDLKANGRYSDLEAGRYTQTPASGTMSLNDFVYKTPDFPQGMAVSRMTGLFTPARLEVTDMQGKLGTSAFAMKGFVQNYLGYFLMGDDMLKGQMNFAGKKFNVNEWMVEDPATEATAQPVAHEEGELETVAIPTGLDFVLDCKIEEVIYDNLDLKNFVGRVIIRDGKLLMQNVACNTMGGTMSMNGTYDTQNPAQPRYDMSLGFTNMAIEQVYEKLSVVQSYAPVAKFMKGRFSTNLDIRGLMRSDMMPDLTTLSSVGWVKVLDGTLKDFKPLKLVSDKTKLSKFSEMRIQNLKTLFEIKDGRVWVEPFELKEAGTTMRVQGSNGIDQSMDYDLGFDIPSGAAGAAVADHIGGLVGGKLNPAERIQLDVGLGGTVDNPKITYFRSPTTGTVKEIVDEKIDEVKEEIEDKVEEVKEEVKEQIEDKIDDAKEKARAEADRILKEAEAQAAKIRREGKAAADKIRSESEARAKQTEASAKNPIEKKAKKVLADKIRKEGEESAQKVEREANQRADQIMADARKRADALLK